MGIILKWILKIISQWIWTVHASTLHKVNVTGSMKMKLIGHAVFI